MAVTVELVISGKLIGNAVMAKPKLNPRQKRWLNKFLKEHPEYELKEVWSGLGGDALLRLEGFEWLPMPSILEFADATPGYRLSTLVAQLRKYGDPRKTATHTYTTIYPHCNLNEKLTAILPEGQLSLTIPAAVLAVQSPVNPVIVTWKPKQKARPKQGVQLTLPIVGLEAELFRLRQEKRPHLPPVSSQELLSEKVATWDSRENREVELPQVVIDLLLAQSASEREWQSAIDLYQIIGLGGVMEYIEGLPSLRKYFGTPVSTAAASTAVMPAQTKTKTTVVAVKALN